MKFEVMKKAIPEECLRAFLNKETRYDGRKFNSFRQFHYTPNALDSFPNSAIGNLGENKVILVLKDQQNHNQSHLHSNDPFMQISIDCNTTTEEKSSTNTNTNSLCAFVNKLISNNLTKSSTSSMSNDKSYTLFITIESQDGNIYDTISLSLNRFLGKESSDSIGFSIKNDYITRTYCIVNNILLTDPLEDEVKQSSFYFSIVKFTTGDVYFHKISGDFAKWDMMTSAANDLSFP